MMHNEVKLIDCMEYMRNMPDGSVDLIITSPPYNLGETHHTGNNKFKAYSLYSDNLPEEEYQLWQMNLLNECHRILSENGSMFYNHKNRIKDGISITPYQWILKSNFILKQELVWFNGSQNFDKIRFYPMTERVYWLVKNKDTKLINVINHHDLFYWKAVGTKEEHKRAFPIKMVSDIIACFPDAKTVFDPFSGSGTTRIVCHDYGKDFIGCEIDPEYYQAQEDRFINYSQQGNLFSSDELQSSILGGTV